MHFAPVLILGLGVVLVSGVREQFEMKPLHPISTISSTIVGLEGTDVTVSAEEQRVAGMSDYSLREYRKDSTVAFSTYVGYYNRQVQGQTIHSPKNCLPGAGWETISASRVSLPGSPNGGTANRVLLSNKGSRALVYYWYQGRGREESNEYVVKWDLLRDAALRGRTEEALVRIVVPLKSQLSAGGNLDDDPEVMAAAEIAEKVARELRAAAASVIPTWTTSDD